MTDLDVRPRAAGAPVRPRGHRWATAVAIATAGTTVASTSVLVFRSDGPVRAGRPAAAAARTTVVPWQALAPHHVTRRLPRDCRPEDVAVIASGSGGGRGASGTARITTAGEPCALRDVALELRAGGGAPFGVVSVPEILDPPPAVIQPGIRAVVSFDWHPPYCGPPVDSLVLLVRLGSSAPVRTALDWTWGEPLDCRRDGRRSLFRYGRPLVTHPSPPLDVRVEAPAAVRANDMLRYRIVVENRTDRPVPLDTCPGYGHEFHARGVPRDTAAAYDHNGMLNCEVAPAVVEPAHPVAFEVRIPVEDLPEGFALDLYTSVSLIPGNGDSQRSVTPLSVRGRVAPVAPRRCGPEDFVVDAYARPMTGYPDDSTVSGSAGFYNLSGVPCDISEPPRLAIVAPDGTRLAEPVPRGAESGRPYRPLEPWHFVSLGVDWSSHCGPHVYAYSYEITFPGYPGRVLVPVDGADSPGCDPGKKPAATTLWIH